MSSDDDEYYYKLRHQRRYDHRKSTRPRRRSSTSSRRRSNYGDGYSYHRNRRSKSWYNYHAARLMATCIFVSLVGYEVFILKAPLTNNIASNLPTFKSQNSRHTEQYPSTLAPATITKNHPPTSLISSHSAGTGALATPLKQQRPAETIVPAPPSPVIQPLSPMTAAAIAATIPVPPSVVASKPLSEVPADVDVESEKSPSGPASYRPLQRKRTSHPPSSKSDAPSLPASALRLDISGVSSEGSGKVGGETSSSNNVGVEKPASKSAFTTVSDKEPSPMPPATSTPVENTNTPAGKPKSNGTSGANPGAGENFWQWFQETKDGGNGTVSDTVNCPEENKRLCTMFYKYVRKYKIRSVYDVSCVKNLDWMPEILQKAGSELWGFKYYCSATDEEGMAKAKEKLSSMKYVDFISDLWWRQGFGQKPELLFAWDTLAHIAYGRVWHFFVKAKSQNIKYILVDNYPGILNDPVRVELCFPVRLQIVANYLLTYSVTNILAVHFLFYTCY